MDGEINGSEGGEEDNGDEEDMRGHKCRYEIKYFKSVVKRSERRQERRGEMERGSARPKRESVYGYCPLGSECWGVYATRSNGTSGIVAIHHMWVLSVVELLRKQHVGYLEHSQRRVLSGDSVSDRRR